MRSKKTLFMILLFLAFIGLSSISGYISKKSGARKIAGINVSTRESNIKVNDKDDTLIYAITDPLENGWQRYINKTFRYYIDFPASAFFSNSNCNNTTEGQYTVSTATIALKALEKQSTVYIASEFITKVEGLLINSEPFPIYSKCEKTNTTVETLGRKNDFINITTYKISKSSQIENFIQQVYGLECKLESFTKTVDSEDIYTVIFTTKTSAENTNICELSKDHILKYVSLYNYLYVISTPPKPTYAKTMEMTEYYDSEIIDTFGVILN